MFYRAIPAEFAAFCVCVAGFSLPRPLILSKILLRIRSGLSRKHDPISGISTIYRIEEPS
jgi:hypothetical protein